MNNYVVFLRAINVGGHRIIKMAVLKEVLETMGLKNVTTFIQSGNVLFKSSEKNKLLIQKKIEKQLIHSFGFEVECFLRADNEIRDILLNNPFKNMSDGKDPMLYIAFLSEEPDKKAVEELIHFKDDNEKYILYKDNLYCHIRKNIKTLFSNNWLEKKLKLKATTRNINTINKISDLF